MTDPKTELLYLIVDTGNPRQVLVEHELPAPPPNLPAAVSAQALANSLAASFLGSCLQGSSDPKTGERMYSVLLPSGAVIHVRTRAQLEAQQRAARAAQSPLVRP